MKPSILLAVLFFTSSLLAQDRWKRTKQDDDDDRITTRYVLMDLGFNDIQFQNSASENRYQDFDFRFGKSVSFTLSPVGQRVNLYNNRFFIEYQTMFEFNSFRFQEDVTIVEDNLNSDILIPSIDEDFKKSKLNIRYFNIPVGLTYRSSMANKGKFKITAGGYIGYLLGANSKIKYGGRRGKVKEYDDFNLNEWKYGIYGEIGIGLVNVYFRQTFSPLFEENRGPDARMFSLGLIIHGI